MRQPDVFAQLSPSPDWGQLTLEQLPGFSWPVAVTLPPEAQQLGFKESLQWSNTTFLADSLLLGSMPDVGEFTLDHISQLSGLNILTLPARELTLLQEQTLADLVTAIPTLSEQQLQSVPFISDLLRTAGYQSTGTNSIGSLLNSPEIAQLPINTQTLSSYRLADIPGLRDTPLANFSNWQQSSFGQVPGLRSVPLASFANTGALTLTLPTIADVVFGEAEHNLTRSISGSYQEGFSVPCVGSCAHIELGAPYEGYQWVSGLSQQVRGGHGPLASLNNGLEPTGRHPFGPGFKVAVLETDEASGTAQTGLFFRLCLKKPPVDLGCSPYFIGPVPWIPIEEEGYMLP